ncbi:hypothetical protein [Nocardia otitidiscaviarum]|uniref:hypothetical protein n=1 Tax=Nocardia otitidiscaviarum TaxID=1823 RepID=UPI0024574B50|nr:hypothetical protein [Nocardia otitidiscaviarum]
MMGGGSKTQITSPARPHRRTVTVDLGGGPWVVQVASADAASCGRVPAGSVVAADLELAAVSLCDRLPAPETATESWYLIASPLTDTAPGDDATASSRLRWANRLRWDGHAWATGQWTPDTGRRGTTVGRGRDTSRR